MELVAAAKMRKSQLAALSARPYSLAVDELLIAIKSQPEITHSLLATIDSTAEIIIIVTSDRGLVGGLNINLFREVLKEDLKNTKLITIGKKASNFAVKTESEVIASFDSEEIPALELARTLTKMAIDTYKTQNVAKIRILYPHFESIIKQVPKWIQILPIELQTIASQDYEPLQNPHILLFEPALFQILEEILPHHILTQIYQALLETKASEHSARMVAMKNATDAASDLIDDLTLTYNQARQEAITKEILDITTAQKAFKWKMIAKLFNCLIVK